MKVVDMHCDTIAEIFERRRRGEQVSILENPLHIDLKKMEKGGYLLQNFALFTHLGREKQPFSYAMKLVDTFYNELEAHDDRIGIVKSWADIEKNRQAGRMSAMMTLEEGGVCRGEIAFLHNFYRLGVRMMTLTWNFPNELGYPNKRIDPVCSGNSYMDSDMNSDMDSDMGGEQNLAQQKQRPVFVPDTEHGLTEKGIEFVREMERIGMIIDISHLNDAGIWDVFRYTKKPFVASHSNARSLASHPRNLTDDMIRSLAERGGVAGINFCAAFLQDEDGNGQEPVHGYCRDMVAHMKHMRKIGGIGCIGLGSDFDGIPGTVEMRDCSGMQVLADEMSRQGFSDGEIEAVFSENVLRLYKELL